MPSSTSSSSSSAKPARPSSSAKPAHPSSSAAPSSAAARSSSSSAQASASSSHAPLHTPITISLSPPSELSSLVLSPIPPLPPLPLQALPQPPTSSPPKRPRSQSTLRALALAALTEDLVSHNASAGRLPPESDVFAVPLPSLSTILSAPGGSPPAASGGAASGGAASGAASGLPDGVLVCGAIFLARLDAVHAVASDSASCALVGCLASAALAVRGGGAGDVLASVEAAAGLDAGEARAYAEIVHVYIGKESVGISVGDFRDFDEMLREMVAGL